MCTLTSTVPFSQGRASLEQVVLGYCIHKSTQHGLPSIDRTTLLPWHLT